MITLNTEKGLVRIEHWDDLESRPGFKPVLDPKTITLKEIIGRYVFPFDIPCGLSNCRTLHKHVFLVASTDGRETNLGRDCGKREFGASFESLSRVFVAAERAQRNREFLWDLKHRLPTITAEVTASKAGELGAGWMQTRISHLTGKSGSMPQPIVSAVRQVVRRGDGALMVQRATTKEEREVLAAATQVRGLDRRNRVSDFVEVQVGHLDGFAALSPGNGLREILVTIDLFTLTLAGTDIDNLTDKQLRSLSKAGVELEPSLERLRTVLSAGKRLLVRENIQQLSRFATNRAEEKLFDLFLRELPA